MILVRAGLFQSSKKHDIEINFDCFCKPLKYCFHPDGSVGRICLGMWWLSSYFKNAVFPNYSPKFLLFISVNVCHLQGQEI